MADKDADRTGVGLDHWGDAFPDTHWTVLFQNPDQSAETKPVEDKFTHLCSRYWYPLYAFLRKRGRASHDAQDLTQGFFAYLLSADRMSKLDPAKGRFRTYLLGALTHYLSDHRKFETAAKRGGGVCPISIELELAENRFQNEPADDLTPEKLFDRQWAMTILDESRSRLEKEYVNQRKGHLFSEVGKFLTEKPDPGAYADVSHRLALSEENVRAIISRMRKRYKAILREQVHATVSSSDEVDGEIQYLLSSFG